jgi:hypothetical protein
MELIHSLDQQHQQQVVEEEMVTINQTINQENLADLVEEVEMDPQDLELAFHHKDILELPELLLLEVVEEQVVQEVREVDMVEQVV